MILLILVKTSQRRPDLYRQIGDVAAVSLLSQTVKAFLPLLTMNTCTYTSSLLFYYLLLVDGEPIFFVVLLNWLLVFGKFEVLSDDR